MRVLRCILLACALILSPWTVASGAELRPFTVRDARNLPVHELATELLGDRLASRVIEARRYEYGGPSGSVPEYVEFFTQPELSSPVINGICRTDAITIEYNWVDYDGGESPTAPLKIARIAAKTQYKSFPEPSGDPGSEAYTKMQTAACAAMKTASNSFRAPTGGDAQWLAAIHREYSDPGSGFTFTCDDFADPSCEKAREALQSLQLDGAEEIRLIDCPKVKTGDQVDYCYKMVFDYPSEQQFPNVPDYDEPSQPEWIISIFAGMRTGVSPVKIRSLHIEHDRQSHGIP